MQRPTNPYGKPSPKGNADEVWKLASQTPCPKCGAPNKHVSIDGKKATITCGGSNG